MPHFRKIEKGAITTVVADESPGDGWDEVEADVAPPVEDDKPKDDAGQTGFPPAAEGTQS